MFRGGKPACSGEIIVYLVAAKIYVNCVLNCYTVYTTQNNVKIKCTNVETANVRALLLLHKLRSRGRSLYLVFSISKTSERSTVL